MAARRLLIVMLILLGLSTLAAALVPSQALREGSTATSTTEETETIPADTVPAGILLEPLKISVGGKTIPVVPLKLGDQLTLVVSSRKADELEMPALGLVDAVGPDEPARFEILAASLGSLKIRFVSNKRIAARVEVTKPGARKRDGKQPAKKPPGKGKPGR